MALSNLILIPLTILAFSHNKLDGTKKIIRCQDEEELDYYEIDYKQENLHKLVNTILGITYNTGRLFLGRWLFSFPSLAPKSYGALLMFFSSLRAVLFFVPLNFFKLPERVLLSNTNKITLALYQVVLLGFAFRKRLLEIAT